MRTTTFLLLLTLTILPLSARKRVEHPRAEIKVVYNYHEKFLRGRDGVVERNLEFVLLTNATRSKFYPPVTEYLDSLDSTPAGRKRYEQMLSAVLPEVLRTGNRDLVPCKKGDLYVFKDRQEAMVEVYEFTGMTEHGCYTEPLAEMQWTVGDSTKTVLDYECIIAHTDYHGRRWTVWFTPEIPVQDGPWKLCGLPGLILEASEADGQHAFTALGLEATEQEMFPVYTPERYEKMERKELLRQKRHRRDNQETLTSALLENYLGGENQAKAGTPVKKVSAEVDFLETDYRE